MNTLPTTPENCGQVIVAPDVPCATFNVGVQIIDNRIYRITQELGRNVSSRVTAFTANDLERIEAYFVDLVDVIENIGASISDFHGLIQWPLTNLAAVQLPVENEAVNSCLSYLLAADFNLRISASARINDGLIEHDKTDLLDAIAKAQSMINRFATVSNPLDQPQSNPREPVATPTV